MRARFGRFFRHRNQRSKLGNTRVSYDGHSFASKLEAAVYFRLKISLAAGEIKIVSHQSRVQLTEAQIIYIPDFKCLDLKTQEIFFVEAKGFETPDWKIKKKLWLHYGPAPLHIWRGVHARPFLQEILTPVKFSNLNKICLLK